MESTRSSRGHTEEIITGLNNTAADGADGFEDFLQIIYEMERVEADKDWCKEVRKRL